MRKIDPPTRKRKPVWVTPTTTLQNEQCLLQYAILCRITNRHTHTFYYCIIWNCFSDVSRVCTKSVCVCDPLSAKWYKCV
jgi:hypothetical protein